MAEYIEREAFLDAIERGKKYQQDADDIAEMLQNFPAADVRPARRGRWLTGNDNPRTYGRIRAMCGRCGAFALAEMVNVGSYKERLSNFCPNCGCAMEVGEENSIRMGRKADV